VLQVPYRQGMQGFWIGFGAGYGSADVSCDGCGNPDRLRPVSGFLKLGGTPSQQFLLGGEFDGWTRKSSGISEYLENALVAVYFYPWVEYGFFVKGGGGMASYLATGPGPDISGTGRGGIGGIGYDCRVGKNISLTPVANVYFGKPGDLSANGTTVLTGWKQNVLDAGLGITFH
jgi:hypothetical protein